MSWPGETGRAGPGATHSAVRCGRYPPLQGNYWPGPCIWGELTTCCRPGRVESARSVEDLTLPTQGRPRKGGRFRGPVKSYSGCLGPKPPCGDSPSRQEALGYSATCPEGKSAHGGGTYNTVSLALSTPQPVAGSLGGTWLLHSGSGCAPAPWAARLSMRSVLVSADPKLPYLRVDWTGLTGPGTWT